MKLLLTYMMGDLKVVERFDGLSLRDPRDLVHRGRHSQRHPRLRADRRGFDAEAYGRELLDAFNQTRHERELPREFVSAELQR